jgi:hypothetical protein
MKSPMAVIATWILFLAPTIIHAGDAEFEKLQLMMEADVKELRNEVERLYQKRCDISSQPPCFQGSYNDCTSRYPNQTCLGSGEMKIRSCGDSVTCSSLSDYTVSSVWMHSMFLDSDGNPSDLKVKETVCFTRELDKFFIKKHLARQSFWDNVGFGTPSMYFGSQNGAFRIYPAKQLEKCGAYDPRKRPWYIAASSGPKNVVLVLDTSSSMATNRRLDPMKIAAQQVIETLTVGDRVAVIEFNVGATIHGQNNTYLFTANPENKELLKNIIGNMSGTGEGTNFLAAFTTAFRLLNDEFTINKETSVKCATAILFLTDGEMNYPADVTEQTVLDLVETGITDLEAFNRNVFLFTFSISQDYEDTHAFPKTIACSTSKNGVWSKIANKGEIGNALTSYYRLLALGLGQGKNENFTSWVEPYYFFDSGFLGTTVSAPVFDKSKTPPLFLGVVGLDFPLMAVDKVLGGVGSNASTVAITNLIDNAICPTLELGECDLEYFRQTGSAASEALCATICNSTDFAKIEENQCSTLSDLPNDLWVNRDLKDRPYTDRVCCVVNETVADSTGQCPSPPPPSPRSRLSVGGILGLTIGGVAVVLTVAWVTNRRCRKPPDGEVGGGADDKAGGGAGGGADDRASGGPGGGTPEEKDEGQQRPVPEHPPAAPLSAIRPPRNPD